ncbi:MAG: hypothetical protein LQ339_005288 [Xanthoria mediterranea]|nr:MAG: hypothetical protein LQ339_005288 [Xanthoria mediterranea]
MPSIKNVLVTLAFAAAVSAQGQQADGQVTAVSSNVVSQITDGQIQAPTSSAGSPVSQISDGQIQAPTSSAGSPVSQISDGQIQAPTSVAVGGVSQISDGQVQAPTSVAVGGASQISDGQVQVPTGASGVAPVPTSNGTFNGGSPAPFVGGASLVTFSGAAIGLAALALML